jgi:hypothetical protein
MLRHVCIILLSAVSASAGDMWLFLKDGRVCLADTVDATSAALSDGKQISLTADQIQGHRTRQQVDQAVDAMLVDIAQSRNMEEHAGRFKVFKQSAVPRLLQHLDKQIGPRKLPVLYALQFCWAPEAFDPVLKLTTDSDKDIVIGAISVLINNVPQEKLREPLKAAADHKDIKVAATAFQFAERIDQDTTLKRVRRILADPNERKSAVSVLSHYFAPDLTAPTASLLKTGTVWDKCAVVGALIVQSAQNADVRTQIAELLSAKQAEVREAAAEYYTWLGRNEDLPALNKALEGEKDIYSRAALQGAIKTIGLRGAIKLRAGPSSVEIPSKDNSTYQRFIAALTGSPTAGDWAAARDFLAKADDYEAFYGVTGKAGNIDQRFRLRTLLQQRIYAAPCGMLDENVVSKFLDEKECPPTAQLVPPIRDYFDPKRKSYGHYMDASNPRFGDSVHVGDDCGWQWEFRTVVSIAPGVVRLVDYIPSWGHIVVVEHMMDGKPFCSLYGHLSPMIHVRPGDVLEAGQKIGAIGRGYSADNGGYFAHLHFGIHRGPYSTEIRWICGYVSPDAFAAGSHGWVDPQEFLKK